MSDLVGHVHSNEGLAVKPQSVPLQISSGQETQNFGLKVVETKYTPSSVFIPLPEASLRIMRQVKINPVRVLTAQQSEKFCKTFKLFLTREKLWSRDEMLEP